MLYIHSAWMVLQSKQSCLFLFYFIFYTIHTCCPRTVSFHLCHFDSLSLWIIKKKHFLNTHPCCRRWFVWINRLLTLSSDTELYTHDVILTAEVCIWMGFYPKQSKWDHLLPRNTQSLEMSLCLLLCLQKSQQCINPFIRNPSECRPLAADFQTTRKTHTRMWCLLYFSCSMWQLCQVWLPGADLT